MAETTYPKTAILSLAKNENWYINDWVDYHVGLGFDRIFIYDNNDIENIGKYIDAKFVNKVQLVDVRGMKCPQNKVYGMWWKEYREKYDWVAVIDIDEYIELVDKGKSIKDILSNSEYLNYGNIRLNWICYGDQDEIYPDLSVPVWKRFLVPNKTQGNNAKSIVNCRMKDLRAPFAHAAVKYDWTISQCMPNLEQCFSNPGSSTFTTSVDRFDLTIMYIKHFVTKTCVEYKVNKYARTDAYWAKSTTNETYFWKWNKKKPEKEEILKMGNVDKLTEMCEKTWVNRPKNTIVENKGQMKAFEVFKNQTRMDLIYKYLYAKNPGNNFIRNAYLDSILAFNGFNEYIWLDGKPIKQTKHGCSDFIDVFDMLIRKASNNSFIPRPGITLDGNYVVDGAHRLAIAAAFNLEIDVDVHKSFRENKDWGYGFFREKGLNECILDFGALQYVRLNPDSYILCLFQVSSKDKDTEVEKILSSHGISLYYKKSIDGSSISFNGWTNLNKIFYSESGEYDSWVGNEGNKFLGAQKHATKKSKGESPLRVYVVSCHDIKRVKEAKKEIRDLYGIGNSSCHINDTHDGTITLGEILLNENSIQHLNNMPYERDNVDFNKQVDLFKDRILKSGGKTEDFVLAGSCPLDAYMMRKSKDIDFLSIDDISAKKVQNDVFHIHDSQLKYYPMGKQQMVENPRNYFYYRGIKIISLSNVFEMKKMRNQIGKDDVDCKMIYDRSDLF